MSTKSKVSRKPSSAFGDLADAGPPVGQTWCEILKSLSVEPAGFMMFMSLVVSYLIGQNLFMETICRVDLGYDEDMCRELVQKVNATYKAQEREIQQVVASISAVTSVIYSACSVILVLIVGPWSDANGRKIPLLFSVAGFTTYALVLMVCRLLMGKINALTYSIIVLLPYALSGGFVVFGMCSISYISDSTNTVDRTMRIGLLSASMRSSTPIGFALAGLMNKVGLSEITCLMVSTCLGIISFLIIIWRVENMKPSEMRKRIEIKQLRKKSSLKVSEAEVEEFLEKRKDEGPKTVYNPVTIFVQAFAILFKERNGKLAFWLLILCHVCYASPGGGEYSMTYLFVRERLGWNVAQYGFFSTYNFMMSSIGVIVSMFILSKALKVPDPIVGFVACLSQIVGSMTYAFTTNSLMMYLGSAFDLMNGTMSVVVKSMLSKIVDPEEVGKLFSFLGLIDSLLPLVMAPAYAMLYKNTVTVFAGSFFLVSAGITVPALIAFLYFICKGSKSWSTEPKKIQRAYNPVRKNSEEGQEMVSNGKSVNNNDGVLELVRG